jgi:hypothetical protein
MVFPTSNRSNLLAPPFEEELLAYIYSGVLFSRNVTPDEARLMGDINAEIVSEIEIWDWGTGADMRSGLPSSRYSFSREIDGQPIRFYPTPNYLLHITFESDDARSTVFAEVQIPRHGSADGAELRSVVQTDPDFGGWLKAQEFDSFPRIIDARKMGMRCLLRGGGRRRLQNVIPLPELSPGSPELLKPFSQRLADGAFSPVPLEEFVRSASGSSPRG